MKRDLKLISCLQTFIIMVSFIGMLNNVWASGPEEFLEWSIETTKNHFYPGEPVLLTLNIRNTGNREEKVHFGIAGVDAFTMIIHNPNGVIVAKGNKIQRSGIVRLPTCAITPGKIGQKSIVLNQWCSTLLPSGQYHVICNVEYRLRSESRKKEGSEVFKAGPLHETQLELDIQIIELDKPKFKKIVETLAGFEVKPEAQSKGEWLVKRDIAREMLSFTESELAIPYQLHLLGVEQYTWRKHDIINSLVKSGTLEATNGLVRIIENPSIYKEDVKRNLIDAVYKLRETGKPEILTATADFVEKYKRPAIQLKTSD